MSVLVEELDLSHMTEQEQVAAYLDKIAARDAAEQAYREAWESVDTWWVSLSPTIRQRLESPGEVPFF